MLMFTQLLRRSADRRGLDSSGHTDLHVTASSRRFPTVRSKAGSGNSPAPLFDPVLRARLRQRLLALPYRPFLQTVVHLLSAQGYRDVAPAGCPRGKGRGAPGGWDLEARYSVDETGPRLCVARVKQFDRQPVDLRYVDELRGAALRAGAQETLLITLSTFSKPARLGALSGPGPVRLTDGEALLDDLLGQEIGVRRAAGRWEVDDTYFDLLERRFAQTRIIEPRMAERKTTERGMKASHAIDNETRESNRTEPSASCAPPPEPGRTALAPCSGSEPASALRITITLNTITLKRSLLRQSLLQREEGPNRKR